MASHDLRRILAGWEYEPNQITVRKITGDDGTLKIQMRLDLGVLQMEVSGRPDGQRPHGYESLLAYHQHRLQKHLDKNGTELGFELSPEESQGLREEAVQYYHRYLAEFVLEDFAGVQRDTARNIQVLDLCKQQARDESDRAALEQYRPYLIMMNTRAQVHLSLRRGSFRRALAQVEEGMQKIQDVFAELGQEEAYDEATEVTILKSLHQEIATRLPVDPLEKLQQELEKAVTEERYEDALVLRERIDVILEQRTTAPVRKRKK